MQKTAAETEAKNAAAKKAMADAAATMIKTQIPGGMIGEMEHEQNMRQKEELHEQLLAHDGQNQIQMLLFNDAQGKQKLKEGKQSED